MPKRAHPREADGGGADDVDLGQRKQLGVQKAYSGFRTLVFQELQQEGPRMSFKAREREVPFYFPCFFVISFSLLDYSFLRKQKQARNKDYKERYSTTNSP